MKRALRVLIGMAAALLLILSNSGGAQVLYSSKSYPLAINWDMDGEAASAAKVVASAALADSTSYTVAANPDVCRPVDVTVTDADSSITAGVLTVTGTDCWGDVLVSTFTFAAGGSGVKSLTVGAYDGSKNFASGAYYSTITSVVSGVLTGEGVGDALTVGYSTAGFYTYPLFGTTQRNLSIPPYRWVDINGRYTVPGGLKVKNGTGNAITTVTASANPFERVAVGDLLIFEINGVETQRMVSVRTDANNVTLSDYLPLPTAGLPFYWKKFVLSSDPQDGWINVGGSDAISFLWEVKANTDTGGVVGTLTCRTLFSHLYPQQITHTATVASTATGQNTCPVDLREAQFGYCQLGLKFGTNDDASDTGTERIYVSFEQRK